jgi:hypothetical protein
MLDSMKSRQRIDVIMQFANGSTDDFLRSQLASFACVLMSGQVENLFKEIVFEFASQRGNTRLSKFVGSALRDFQNPNPTRILDTLKMFDDTWPVDLETLWDGEVKSHVGSVVQNRHQIAHGRATQVTPYQISQWQKSVRRAELYLRQVVLGEIIPDQSH